MLRNILIIFTLSLLFSQLGWANRIRRLKGEVKTLVAPLFARPDRNSHVIGYVRKGDVIYIHSHSNRGGPQDEDLEMDESSFKEIQNRVHLKDPKHPLALRDEFLVTIDLTGNTAYIPSDLVKIIYNDSREFNDLFDSATKDRTDYRLEEPLSKGYPIEQMKGWRGFVVVGAGLLSQENYRYRGNIINTSYGYRAELFTVLAKATYLTKEQRRLLNNRFYFGGMLAYSEQKASFELVNRIFASEKRRISGFGPYLSYDVFKRGFHQVSLMGGMFLNYTTLRVSQTFVVQQVGFSDRITERKHYTAFHLSSRLGILYQALKIFGPLDLNFGVVLDILLPHKLKTNNHSQRAHIWHDGTTDQIAQVLEFGGMAVAGFQYSF